MNETAVVLLEFMEEEAKEIPRDGDPGRFWEWGMHPEDYRDLLAYHRRELELLIPTPGVHLRVYGLRVVMAEDEARGRPRLRLQTDA